MKYLTPGKLIFVLSLLAVIWLRSCNQNNGPMATAMANLPITGLGGVSVAEALGMPLEMQVCVLGPYSHRVDEKTTFATEINDHLTKKNYPKTYDEGQWTFVHGSAGNWMSERIWLRELELVTYKTETGDSGIAGLLCGTASTMQLIKFSHDKLTFKLQEKK